MYTISMFHGVHKDEFPSMHHDSRTNGSGI